MRPIGCQIKKIKIKKDKKEEAANWDHHYQTTCIGSMMPKHKNYQLGGAGAKHCQNTCIWTKTQKVTNYRRKNYKNTYIRTNTKKNSQLRRHNISSCQLGN